MAWHDEYPHSIFASVLLLDGKIENWKVGGHIKGVSDFSGFWKMDRLNDYKAEHKEFIANTSEEHNRIFSVDSAEWFRQWQVAEDYKGFIPYE
jgi:hypothetical protein